MSKYTCVWILERKDKTGQWFTVSESFLDEPPSGAFFWQKKDAVNHLKDFQKRSPKMNLRIMKYVGTF